MAIPLQNNSFLAAIEAAMKQGQASSETPPPSNSMMNRFMGGSAKGKGKPKMLKPKAKLADRNADIKGQTAEAESSLREIQPIGSKSFRDMPTEDMDKIISIQGKEDPKLSAQLLDELSNEDLASFTPSTPTNTRETMPKLGDEMRSIDTGVIPSNYSTMPKLEMGTTDNPEAFSNAQKSVAEVAAQTPEANYDEALLNKLFQTTHGTSFNPKAKGDVKSMGEIKTLLNEMGGKLGKVTPNQFALQIYRKFKYL